MEKNYGEINISKLTEEYNIFINNKNKQLDDLNKEKIELINSKKYIRTIPFSLLHYENKLKKEEQFINDQQKNIKIFFSEKDKLQLLIEDIQNKENTQILYNEYIEIKNQLINNKNNLEKINEKINEMRKILNTLNKHKYDPNCKYCMDNQFVKDAIATKDKIIIKEYDKKLIELMIFNLEQKIKMKKFNDIEEKNKKLIDNEIKNIDINNKIISISHKIELLNKDIELKIINLIQIKETIKFFNENIESLEYNKNIDHKIKLLEQNKLDIEKIEHLAYNNFLSIKSEMEQLIIVIDKKTIDQNNIEKNINEIKNNIEIKEKLIVELLEYEKIQLNNNKINKNIIQIKKELTEKQVQLKQLLKNKEQLIEKICHINKEIEMYLLNKQIIINLEKELKINKIYIELVSKNGLPYELFQLLIPKIQNKMNEILMCITKFSIIIDLDEDNKILIYKVEENIKINLELCSGFEKFITNLALRVALIKLSNISTCNFMIFDESFLSIDSTYINNLSPIFATLKDSFQFILLISHSNIIKGYCDDALSIKRKNNFSHITNIK